MSIDRGESKEFDGEKKIGTRTKKSKRSISCRQKVHRLEKTLKRKR